MSTDLDIYSPADRLVTPEEVAAAAKARWHLVFSSVCGPQVDKLGRSVDDWILYGARSENAASHVRETLKASGEQGVEALADALEFYVTQIFVIHPYSFEYVGTCGMPPTQGGPPGSRLSRRSSPPRHDSR